MSITHFKQLRQAFADNTVFNEWFFNRYGKSPKLLTDNTAANNTDDYPVLLFLKIGTEHKPDRPKTYDATCLINVKIQHETLTDTDNGIIAIDEILELLIDFLESEPVKAVKCVDFKQVNKSGIQNQHPFYEGTLIFQMKGNRQSREFS